MCCAILIGIGQRLHLAGEDLDQVRVVAAFVVDALERLQAGQEERIHVEGAPIERDALVGLIHVLLEQIAQVAQDHLLVLVRHGNVERAGQRLAHLLPLGAKPVDRRHLAQHLDVVRSSCITCA